MKEYTDETKEKFLPWFSMKLKEVPFKYWIALLLILSALLYGYHLAGEKMQEEAFQSQIKELNHKIKNQVMAKKRLVMATNTLRQINELIREQCAFGKTKIDFKQIRRRTVARYKVIDAAADVNHILGTSIYGDVVELLRFDKINKNLCLTKNDTTWFAKQNKITEAADKAITISKEKRKALQKRLFFAKAIESVENEATETAIRIRS